MDLTEFPLYICSVKYPEMRFELKEIEGFPGEEAHVYSVVMEGDTTSLLEQFFDENGKYKKDIRKIRSKILTMTLYEGCRKEFFKEGEGKWGDGVVALKYSGRLRLYGIYFNRSVILFGSGGYKPPSVRAYQDYPPLNEKAQQMREIAKIIYNRIKDGELKFNHDGTLTND